MPFEDLASLAKAFCRLAEPLQKLDEKDPHYLAEHLDVKDGSDVAAPRERLALREMLLGLAKEKLIAAVKEGPSLTQLLERRAIGRHA